MQEARFEREKSLLRAAQAELDLEETKKKYKEMVNPNSDVASGTRWATNRKYIDQINLNLQGGRK